MNASAVYIGCAGWSIPKHVQSQFPSAGTHLARYALQFNAVEINSSFYRAHQPKTYQRWADSVPEYFCFAVKVPKEITHERRLIDCRLQVDRFLAEVHHLGRKLGPLLVQLPPSLEFEKATAAEFFGNLRHHTHAPIVCEPRHASWFTPAVDELLNSLRISRVGADPALLPAAAAPGGWMGLAYFRLHGSPRMYYSAYDEKQLDHYAHQHIQLRDHGTPVWCIFDNTAADAAFENALDLAERVGKRAHLLSHRADTV